MRNLAVHMIESHFSIKTLDTVWDEHLYETCGFKQLIGDELVNEIVTADALPRGKISINNKISVRQWCDKRYGIFDSLNIQTKQIRNGILYFNCHSDDRSFNIPLIVDLKGNQIFIDIEGASISSDVELKQLEYRIAWNQFFRDYLANGQLEVFVDDKTLLGRSNANMPVNIDVRTSIDRFNSAIEKLQQRINEITTQST